MTELVKLQAAAPAEKPFLLGIGSVINPTELDAAIEMGFDIIEYLLRQAGLQSRLEQELLKEVVMSGFVGL